jgi:hypothetical protein
LRMVGFAILHSLTRYDCFGARIDSGTWNKRRVAGLWSILHRLSSILAAISGV